MIISIEDYQQTFVPRTVFDSAPFLRLNAGKVAEVAVVAAHGLALALGSDAETHMWKAPFSAPFAMPAGAGDYDAFAREIVGFADGNLQIVVPPPFHADAERWIEALDNQGLVREDNYNYHYPLERLDNPKSFMSKDVKRNYNHALRQGFMLQLASDGTRAYDFIADHHRKLGYRMAMTSEQVLATTQVADIDFFECRLDDQLVGAAIFYHVAPGVVQLINWGDELSMRNKHITNYIAFRAFEHYREIGMKVVDLGPASVDGIKNEGLVRFKLAIGCVETLKPTFYASKR